VEHRVASVDDLEDGESLLVEVGEKRIAVFRHDGEVFAIDDECPHRGGSLHEGPVQDHIASCPWHQWQFDIRTGVSPVNPLSSVSTYPTRVDGQDLFVMFE